jgi:hypothetical protein
MDSIESKLARVDERTQMMMEAIKQLDAKVSAPCPHHAGLTMDVGTLQKMVHDTLAESRMGDAEIKAIVQEAIAESKVGDAEVKKEVAVLAAKVSGVIGIATVAGAVLLPIILG